MSFDFRKLPRCSAKAKSTGQQCGQAAMLNGKCYLHGGKSTGARTFEGKEKLREINIKHGYYLKKAIEERRKVKTLLELGKKLIKQHDTNKSVN